MNNWYAKKLLLVVVLFIAIALDACQSQVAKTVQYAGQVNDSKSFIAIATNGTDILAYVCDGTDTDATIAEWFKGTLSGKSFSLTSKSTAQLIGQIEDGAAIGTLTLADGSPLAFNAPLATGNAGLYRKEVTENGSDVISGWIVLKDGEVRGATLAAAVGFGANVAPPSGPKFGVPGPDIMNYINAYYFHF